MSPQEPHNPTSDPLSPQNEPVKPVDLPPLSSSAVDNEPPTQASEQFSPQPIQQQPVQATDIPKPATADTLTDTQPAPVSTADTYVPVTPQTLDTSMDPVAVPAMDMPQGVAPLASPKKSPKKLIAIIIAAVLVLLALGGGVAFAVWYASPQKVLNDSFVNFMNTPPKSVNATAAVSVEDTNFKVSVTSFTDGSDNAQANVKFDVTSGGTAVNINVDAIAAKNGDLYFRINDAKKLVAQVTQGSPEAAAMFEGMLKKVDTKWVKITAADLEKLTGQEKSPDSECVSNAITAFQSDEKQKKEVADLYTKNQFVTVKEQKPDEVVDGRNSFHYVLDADEAKAKSFAEGMKQTQIYKKIEACLGDSAKDDSKYETKTEKDDTVTNFEIWVDKSTRRLSKVALTSSSAENKGNAKISAIIGYNTRVVTLPVMTTSIKEVQQEIQDMFSSPAPLSDELDYETSLRTQ